MSMKRQITEYLDIDLEKEMWCCHCCGRELISARDNYKKGCLVYDRDPREIYQPLVDEPPNYAPDPTWMRYVEFYCPGCATMIEVEALAPGHPVTHDIELDIDKLKQKQKYLVR